jgi:Ca2+-binding RTX toxin-like protein
MATYDYSKAGLGEVLDETGTFSEADRSAILDGLQSIGVFDAGSTAGELGRGETLFLGDPSQSDSEEFLLYDGDPTGPVEITGENKAVIFETTDSVEANIDASGETVVATGQGDDVITSQGASKDYIVAGDGENTVKSGAGADTVISGTGNDTIEAGSGNDTVSAGTATTRSTAAAATTRCYGRRG